MTIAKILSSITALCVSLVAALAVSALYASAQDQPDDRALVDALRKGGYVIYFRHAATDWSQNDQVTAVGDWTSCEPSRMRQLSDQGRAAARRIGEAIQRLDIPVGRVLSSEYCRARETAQLMDLGPVTATRALMNMRVAEMVGGRAAVVARARAELARAPEPGTNTVLVAHGNLMRAASGAYTGEAGAVVFEPLGEKAFRQVRVLAPESWQQFAETFAQN
jgi:phosphohistidine phosphatase SixA